MHIGLYTNRKNNKNINTRALYNERLPGWGSTAQGQTQPLETESEFGAHGEIHEELPYAVRDPEPQQPEVQGVVVAVVLRDHLEDAEAEPGRPRDAEQQDEHEGH